MTLKGFITLRLRAVMNRVHEIIIVTVVCVSAGISFVTYREMKSLLADREAFKKVMLHK